MNNLEFFKPSPQLLAYAADDPDAATCFTVGEKDKLPLAHVFVVKGHENGTRVRKWLETEKLSTPNPEMDALDVQGFATAESAVRQAWDNALRNQPEPAPGSLLAELRNAMLDACEPGKEYANTHRLYQFTQRIARRPDPDDLSKWLVPNMAGGLLYQYAGDWDVTNRDLDVAGDVGMWLNRYLPLTAHTALYNIYPALKNKRTTQALERYKQGGLRREHTLLIFAASFEVNMPRGDGVSIFVQGKRPLGDSWIPMSIYQAVRWPLPRDAKGEVTLSEAEEERAWDLFDELPFALRDVGYIVFETISQP